MGLNPNPRRHEIRKELAQRRRESFELKVNIHNLEKAKWYIPEGMRTKLRHLRSECRRLSTKLRHEAPLLDEKGLPVWRHRDFWRFRHSSTYLRWDKVVVEGPVGGGMRWQRK
jgi:hypothetical protein